MTLIVEVMKRESKIANTLDGENMTVTLIQNVLSYYVEKPHKDQLNYYMMEKQVYQECQQMTLLELYVMMVLLLKTPKLFVVNYMEAPKLFYYKLVWNVCQVIQISGQMMLFVQEKKRE